MFIQALLIALWAGIAGVDMFDGLTHIHRPIVTGLVIGLILGDVKTGLIVGASLELVWMGMVPLAGAQPPNVVIGGIIGTSLAIIAKVDAQVALGLAVPFAIAVQACITLFFTILSPMMHIADKCAEKADTKGIEKINYGSLALLFAFYFIIAFLPIQFGAEQAAAMVQALPEGVIEGLKVAGGMMPAIGFAMLLKIMLKKEYTAFLILGYVLAAYLHLDTLAIALLGLVVALYDYYRSSSQNIVVEKEAYEDGI